MGLKLDFHQKTGKGWTFSASLGPSKTKAAEDADGDEDDDGGDDGSGQCTVKSFLQDIVGKGVPLPGLIPGEVLDIPLGRPDGDGEVLDFKCALFKGKRPDEKNQDKEIETEMIMLTASINISKVSLTFVQWRDTSWKSHVQSKRVIKVTLSDMDPAKVPLVRQLKQPFDQLAYMWVADRATEELAKDKSVVGKTVAEKTSAERQASGGQSKSSTKNKTRNKTRNMTKNDALTIAGKPKGNKKKPGITMSEMTALAPFLTRDSDKLFYKTDAPDPTKIPPGDVVVEAGSHFVIVVKSDKGAQRAVLDYVFGRPKEAKPEAIERGQTGGELLASAPGDDEIHPKDPAKSPFKKSVGPLSIENIGLTFDLENQRLGIKLDATFLLGPIGLALLGFGVSVQIGDLPKPPPLPPLGFIMSSGDMVPSAVGKIPVSNPKATLDGRLVSFDRPPITIAGGFVRTKMDGATYYAGGLILGFVPWKLTAIGVYGDVPRAKKPAALTRRHRRQQSSCCVVELRDDDELDLIRESEFRGKTATVDETSSTFLPQDNTGSFTMVFVILKLEGPLFSVGFTDLSGLTAGVGVNSHKRLPTAETVLDFPFTKPSGTPSQSAGPLASLRAVLYPDKTTPWFVAREGSMWVAAGVKATAFALMSVDAVLVVQLNPDVQLGIFGVAVVDVPSLVSPVKFAHAELGIACVLDLSTGTFRFDAQLSPRSYVLDESCHLTGGMAMYAWFSPLRPGRAVALPDEDDGQRPGDGEWVLTIGGFHQAFVRPGAYPNPPRVGIAWSLGENLRITGEAYFAVTPRICMGGGRIHAALTLGALSAWFDAYLDFLINFRPFKFAADGRLSVVVRFSMDMWLVTVRINAEIGAVLSVLGPPMAGRVYVDFWVFGFDIDFGDRDRAIREGNASSLGLLAFLDLVLKGAGKAVGSGVSPSSLMFGGGGSGDGSWVHMPKEDAKRSREVARKVVEDDDDEKRKKETSSPFLFNCTAGLLTDNDVPGGGDYAKRYKSKSQGQNGSPAWMATMFRDTPIPSNTWGVKAGELSWTVTCAFAASAAKFYDERTSRPPMIPAEDTVSIPSAQAEGVYALPMRLTGSLTSTVTITVTQEDKQVRYFGIRPNGADKDRRDDRWSVKPILKSLPRSLWGRYDPDTDPALKGNAVSALLNPPTAKGSVNLVTGFTIRPPLPYRSKDEVPKFNLVEDMRVSVKKGGYVFVGVKDTADQRWRPRPPPDGGKEKDKGKGKGKEVRWDVVQKAWNTQAMEDCAENVVSLWSEAMGWTEKDHSSSPLTGRRPKALLCRFKSMVPAAPMITAEY